MNCPNRPGISRETLEKAEVYFSDYPEPGSIKIPYFDSLGAPTGFSRYRLPKVKPNGQKYYREPGSGVHVYFPPGWLKKLAQLFLSEGEFKCLSLEESGYQIIGLTGLYTYTRNQAGVPTLLPEIQTALSKTGVDEVFFFGDNDTSLNLDFSAQLISWRLRLPQFGLSCRDCLWSVKKELMITRKRVPQTFETELTAILKSAVLVEPRISFIGLAEVLLSLVEKQFSSLAPVELQLQIERLIRLVASARTSGESTVAVSRLENLAIKLAGVNKRDSRKSVDDFLVRQRQASTAATASSQAKKQTSQSSPPPGPDQALIKLHGLPAQLLLTGELLKFNEPFWAAHYARQKEKIIYEPHEREFYNYDSAIGIYVPISPELIRSELSTTILQASRSWPRYSELEHCRNQNVLNGITGHLRGQLETRDFCNSTLYLVHLGNCTLQFNLSGGFTVENFSPDHHSRNRSPINYDPAADCAEFKDLMLGHLEESDRELLQKYAGQCLLGRNITQRFLILDGVGGASKGSFILVINGIIGPQNVYELRTNFLLERFEIGRMIGRTLLVGSDVRGDFLSRYGAHRIKSLVGGDALEAELKGSNQRFTVYGVFNLLIYSNARLHIHLEGDRSAWERRLSIVRYDKPFIGQRIFDVDQYLLGKEASGILNWCIEGLTKLLEDYDNSGDIVLSNTQKDRVDTLLSESDSLRLFVRDSIIKTQAQPGRQPDSLTGEEIVHEYVEDCVDVKHWVPIPLAQVEKQLPNLIIEFFGVTNLSKTNKKRGYIFLICVARSRPQRPLV